MGVVESGDAILEAGALEDVADLLPEGDVPSLRCFVIFSAPEQLRLAVDLEAQHAIEVSVEETEYSEQGGLADAGLSQDTEELPAPDPKGPDVEHRVSHRLGLLALGRSHGTFLKDGLLELRPVDDQLAVRGRLLLCRRRDGAARCCIHHGMAPKLTQNTCWVWLAFFFRADSFFRAAVRRSEMRLRSAGFLARALISPRVFLRMESGERAPR